MSKLLVILRQRGEGCDYTIACGTKVIEVPSDLDGLDAVKWLEEKIRDDYSGEQALAWAQIVEVSNSREINLPLLYARFDREEADAKIKATVEKERADYERLKEKFGT